NHKLVAKLRFVTSLTEAPLRTEPERVKGTPRRAGPIRAAHRETYRMPARSLLRALALVSLIPAVTHAQQPDWKTVKVPEVWKNPPAGVDNLSWYRGFAKTPDEWKGKDLELFVEPTDAATEVYFNGKKIGGAGEFPPFFRSGLGGADRFFVPADSVNAAGPN